MRKLLKVLLFVLIFIFFPFRKIQAADECCIEWLTRTIPTDKCIFGKCTIADGPYCVECTGTELYCALPIRCATDQGSCAAGEIYWSWANGCDLNCSGDCVGDEGRCCQTTTPACPTGYSDYGTAYNCTTSCSGTCAGTEGQCCLPATPTPTTTPGATPTPTNTPIVNSYIRGNIYEYDGAGFTGDYCGGQASDTSLTIQNALISTSADNLRFNSSFYSINTNSISGTTNLTLALDSTIPEADRSVCGCPAATNPANPYLCTYYNVPKSQSGVNFFLKPYSNSNSWFQTFGGNIFARSNIASILPVANCVAAGTCEDSLVAKSPGSSNPFSSGFTLTTSTDNSSIATTDSLLQPRAYINSSDRSDNLNSYATSVKINSYGYNYFSNQLSGDIDLTLVAGSANLDDIRTDASWNVGDINIIRIAGDLDLDETHNWNVQSGEIVVVLVDGDLDISDSTIDSGTSKIVSVAEGGFLAFFANNNITFDESIGYFIDPASPSIIAVSNSNANVEGVFVADNILTIDDRDLSSIADRKFIGAGNFVGWTNINLARDFDDGNQGLTLSSLQAVENFIFRPDFMLNYPNELKVINSNWRELNPQFIEN